MTRRLKVEPATIPRRLYLSPASLAAVRAKSTPEDRIRLDQLVATDAIRIVRPST